jgi:hypothetical protein
MAIGFVSQNAPEPSANAAPQNRKRASELAT